MHVFFVQQVLVYVHMHLHSLLLIFIVLDPNLMKEIK